MKSYILYLKMRLYVLYFILILTLFYLINAAPQQPEINDQFETTPSTTSATDEPVRRSNAEQPQTLYTTLTAPIIKIASIPKVASVLRNIGTCIVNGAMELISFYLPAPLMPLVASAAGFVIPFEPVVMLKERMPVNSYRRALKTAVNSFMGTFDKYKLNDDVDPYMTRRFNRRFNQEKKVDGVEIMTTNE